jgi:hypothetical protein
MKSAVCTLFGGQLHYGLGALANSLYAHGFRGTIFAGFDEPLPPWAQNVEKHNGFFQFKAADGLLIRFIHLEPDVHFSNYKPDFILDVWEKHCPQADALFYFDPDITIKCRWTFFEEWVGYGIALIQDITNSNMPDNHPIRCAWKHHAETLGLTVKRPLSQYFNAGFIGLIRSYASSLELWKQLQHSLKDVGVDTSTMMPADGRSNPFGGRDQDMMNIMAMVTEHPLSTIGPEGMDLIHGGFTMSHALGKPKPWAKNFFKSALKGSGVSMADKSFWKHCETPIKLFDRRHISIRRFELKAASAVSRFIRRA